MCFTLWQHNQPTGIYCRPMVNHFNPRPEVYDICKYYFAHCMNCSQHNIGLRLLAWCHQKSICWALTILTSPPPLPPSLPPGQVPGTPRARSGCRHFQGLHPAEMRVNIIYGTFQDIHDICTLFADLPRLYGFRRMLLKVCKMRNFPTFWQACVGVYFTMEMWSFVKNDWNLVPVRNLPA